MAHYPHDHDPHRDPYQPSSTELMGWGIFAIYVLLLLIAAALSQACAPVTTGQHTALERDVCVKLAEIHAEDVRDQSAFDLDRAIEACEQ